MPGFAPKQTDDVTLWERSALIAAHAKELWDFFHKGNTPITTVEYHIERMKYHTEQCHTYDLPDTVATPITNNH